MRRAKKKNIDSANFVKSEGASATLKASLSLSILAALAVLYAKLVTDYVPNWHIVAGPLYLSCVLAT